MACVCALKGMLQAVEAPGRKVRLLLPCLDVIFFVLFLLQNIFDGFVQHLLTSGFLVHSVQLKRAKSVIMAPEVIKLDLSKARYAWHSLALSSEERTAG